MTLHDWRVGAIEGFCWLMQESFGIKFRKISAMLGTQILERREGGVCWSKRKEGPNGGRIEYVAEIPPHSSLHPPDHDDDPAWQAGLPRVAGVQLVFSRRTSISTSLRARELKSRTVTVPGSNVRVL